MADTPTTPTPKNFTKSDALLFNKADRWYRFVPWDGYLAVFEGRGGVSSQNWDYITTINKEYAKGIWDAAVSEGFVKMEME
jgi:hypothetical protein